MIKLQVRTPRHECMVDITDQVRKAVSESGITDGLCHIFVPHTTAALAINENADPSVPADILGSMSKIVPWKDDYEHSEGNSAAHIKSCLFGQDHSIILGL
jgi:secondary thiamine-phosphate synthase enzyme